MNTVDWTAVGAIAGLILAALALAAAAAAYGVHRQKVTDLEDHNRTQDGRLDKVEAALSATQDTRRDVGVVTTEVRNFRSEVQAEFRHVAELATERMDGLRNEVRAFMNGQTSAGAPIPRRPKQGA